MARLQGISGGMSGKTGSFTYRQSRGETIVSQYQPVVKNPNTEGQQTQRARFKLITQLAAIMAPGFGTMSVTKRPNKLKPTQRNSFVALNMNLATAELTPDGVIAKIPMEQIQLTTSFRQLPNIVLSAGDGASVVIAMNDIPLDVAIIRAVLLNYRTGVAAIESIVDIPVTDHNGFNVSQPVAFPSGQYTVLAYGLIPSATSRVNIDLDNIHTPEDEEFISAVELNLMVANGGMSETITVGCNYTFS